jgi:hypothetical protein
MADTKERNFCFAHKGGQISTEVLETLHVIRAEGTFCGENGNWFVRVSLHRNYGRRAANIPNIIDDYNTKADSRIEVVPVNSSSPKFICFKTVGQVDSNPILYRINTDSQSNATYWKWEVKKERQPGKRPAASKSTRSTTGKRTKLNAGARITTGLEGLARELNLDPPTLDMQGAYTKISQNYFALRGEQLSSTGQFEAEDKAFLLDQLGRFFNREMAYSTKPFEAPTGHRKLGIASRPTKTIAALAARNGGTVEDFEFVRKSEIQQVDAVLKEPNPFIPLRPNVTISACLQKMVTHWLRNPALETVEVSANDIVRELNGGSIACGTYRSTCVPGFLRPFITDGHIRIKDEKERPWSYIVDVKGIAAKLLDDDTT